MHYVGCGSVCKIATDLVGVGTGAARCGTRLPLIRSPSFRVSIGGFDKARESVASVSPRSPRRSAGRRRKVPSESKGGGLWWWPHHAAKACLAAGRVRNRLCRLLQALQPSVSASNGRGTTAAGEADEGLRLIHRRLGPLP